MKESGPNIFEIGLITVRPIDNTKACITPMELSIFTIFIRLLMFTVEV